MEDSGRYMCLVQQQKEILKERIILLAIITVTILPTPPILQRSTLRLIARVNPDTVVSKITWLAPTGISLKTEKSPKSVVEAKLPQVKTSEKGAYVCVIHPHGRSNKTLFSFNVYVAVNGDKVAKISNTVYEQAISTATSVQTSFLLTCAPIAGDYVELYWQAPNTRDSTRSLDAGKYICKVFINDHSYSQQTMLSVLKATVHCSSSKMELKCIYTERPQVLSAKWTYQNNSHKLNMFSSSPGSITTTVPLPITPDTAGNYTCTLKLHNGQIAMHTLTLHPKEDDNDATPSLLYSLFALLLVPLVAVGVLLWRRKHICDRGIEQSLSVASGEVENIYENPEDTRQASQASVYMDLKPREEDVYKELERYEQCQS
ncbi:g6f-like [Aulostomus maculatus]